MSRSRLATDAESRGGGDSSELATLAVRGPAGEHAGFEAPKPGDRVGRYVVEGCIGQGGMGIVLRARDPALDRVVALKLLRAEAGRAETEGSARLLREAQALAKLSHPHVIDIYDVGTIDGQVFIAMEHVAGPTLGAWIRAAPRSVDEILHAFVAAGRGLAAAHAVGLVHRDFKPHNVLVGEDGRVRVVDFGLAAPPGRRSGGMDTTGDSPPGFDLRVTATGMVMGTPAYMAPECQRGDPVDARSDQFSFCVALFEALWGQRPFRASSPGRLAAEIASGKVEVPASPAVPARVRAAILRGLRPAPTDRWPSMEALIVALRPRRLRAWWWVAGVSAVGVVAGIALLRGGARDPCEEAITRITAAYDDHDRAAIAAAFASAGVSYADDTLARVSARLEAYAQELAAARRDVCAANPAADQAALDQRTACLDRRAADLESLVDALADAGAEGVRNAAQAAGNLEPIERCEREGGLALPQAIAARVEAARAELGRAGAMMAVGKLAEALEIDAGVVAEAEALSYEPLRAEALLRRGLLLQDGGDYAASARALEEAAMLAQAVGHDTVTAEAATQLAFVLGNQMSRHEDAMAWERHATAAVERLGDAPVRTIHLLSTRGNLAMATGRFEEAREHFTRGLELQEAELSPEHPLTLTLRSNLGLVHHQLGDDRRALELLLQCLDLRIAVLGPSHPDVGSTHGNLGVVYQTLGELDDASRHTRLGLDILESSLGRDHPHYPQLLTNLANTEYLRGEHDEAARLHHEAMEHFRRTMGPRSILEGRSLSNLGALAHKQGRLDEARDKYRAAIEIWEERLGPDHPELATGISNLAKVDADTGRVDESIAGFTRALEILERALGPGNVGLAGDLVERGNALLAAGRVDDALADLERAVDLRTRTDEDPASLGEARFGLGRALWAADRREEAVAAVKQAKIEVSTREDDRRIASDIAAWLDAHG